jgi:hypothetical protein
MEMMIWNIVLSAIVAVMGFMLKGKFDELDRLGILLNRTREEVARDHITRAEVHRDMEKIMERFDAGISRLEAKIDELSRRGT